MLGTNRQFETLLSALDNQIGKLEVLVRQGSSQSIPLLERLAARRRVLRLLLLNRRVEAAKRIVDFAKWREGNGAIFQAAFSERRTKA